MKKIICIVLAIFIYANTAFAYGNVQYDDFNEYKSKYRILYGALLVIGGGLLAYDGFRTVKVNKSKASVNMNFSSFWYTDSGSYSYVMQSKGEIKNTGNVDLRNVNVWVRYKTLESSHYEPSALGKRVTYDGNPAESPLPNLAIGDSKNWTNDYSYSTGSIHIPAGNDAGSPTNPNENFIYHEQYPSTTPTTLAEIVKVEYDYTKKYKDEMNNEYEGILGLLLIAGGAYLLIDYVISRNKFDYYMKRNNVNFYVENTAEEFKFMLSKKL